jgi:Domain of unknown function (DUF4149)
MRVLRYCYAAALAVWVGGIVVAGLVVAASVFGVLQSWDPSQGRVLAGLVFGEILRRLHLVGYAAGGVMLIALTLQRLLGPRPAGYGLRATLVAVMLALTMASGFGVSPRVEAMQRSVKGPISALPAEDDRRMTFNRLHGLSNVLLLAVAAGGFVLLLWETRE